MSYLVPHEVVEFLLHCQHPIRILLYFFHSWRSEIVVDSELDVEGDKESVT
jgi:hypothetical protein